MKSHAFCMAHLKLSTTRACRAKANENNLCSLLCGHHKMPPPPASGDLNSHIERPCDLLTWNWCGIWEAARTTFRPILAFLRHFVVELWANMHQTDHMTLLAWPLTSPRMPVMRVIILDLCTKFEVCRSFLREIWSIFLLSIQRPRPFELQMGSRAARVMGFLPADFQLAMTFYSRVKARDKGQTERWTDRRRPSTLHASTLRRRGAIAQTCAL